MIMAFQPEILLIGDNADDRVVFFRAAEESGLNTTVSHASGATAAVLRLNRMGTCAGTSLPSLIVFDLSLRGSRATRSSRSFATPMGHSTDRR